MKNLIKFGGLAVLALMAVWAAFGFTFDSDQVMALAAGPLVSTDPMRAAYGRFVQYLENMGKVTSGGAPIITQTDLRLEAKIESSKNNYTLDLKEGTSSTDRPLENKLNNNDIFMVTAIGIGIYKTNDTVYEPLFTFPDLNYFSAAGEAAALESIYNGKLSLTTDSLKRIKNLLLHHMRFVPPTQYDGTDKIMPGYGAMIEERGYLRTNPNIIIDGSKTNTLEVAIGSGDHSAIEGAAGKDNILTVLLHGFVFSGQTGPDTCA